MAYLQASARIRQSVHKSNDLETAMDTYPVIRTRKPTTDELKRAVKGLYWHPARGWLIDEPNVTTHLPKPQLEWTAYAVHWGD